MPWLSHVTEFHVLNLDLKVSSCHFLYYHKSSSTLPNQKCYLKFLFTDETKTMIWLLLFRSNPILYLIFYMCYMPNTLRWSLTKLRFYKNFTKRSFFLWRKAFNNSIRFSRIYCKWSCNFSIHDQLELNQIKHFYFPKLCLDLISPTYDNSLLLIPRKLTWH